MQIPKVMAPINGKPFLLYLLRLLASQKLNDIILCIGYLGEQVKDFFGNGQNLGISIRYSEEKEKLLGTGGALKQAQYFLNDHFFVINGDTFLPINYSEVEKNFLKQNKKGVMVVYNNEIYTGVKNNVELDDNLLVKRHDKVGHGSNLKYVEAGVLALRRKALDFIDETCVISLENDIYRTLIEQKELAAYITKQRFFDIGTMEQKKVLEEFLKKELR